MALRVRRRGVLSALVPLVACLLVAGCATAVPGLSITTMASGAPEQIPVTVSKPDGAGPFPAIVIMHDCSGLGPRSSGAPGRWSKELVARGYVVIIPDSFTTRGFAGGICTVPVAQRRANVNPDRRAGDARAALAYARSLAYVDGRRIGIMGGSHGGSSTLATMTVPDSGFGAVTGEKRATFVAAVALYPRCETYAGGYKPVAPLLILIGDMDDWTPAEPCRKLADVARAARYPVTIKVYPGAHHAFDSPNRVRYVAARINPTAPGGRGATTGGDPAAWADSIREVVAFFDQHLNR
jgi:dienelactone hydrolase